MSYISEKMNVPVIKNRLAKSFMVRTDVYQKIHDFMESLKKNQEKYKNTATFGRVSDIIFDHFFESDEWKSFVSECGKIEKSKKAEEEIKEKTKIADELKRLLHKENAKIKAENDFLKSVIFEIKGYLKPKELKEIDKIIEDGLS